MTSITQEFTAVGGNRHPCSADWDSDGSGILAFGADCNIALWRVLDDNYRGIYALLVGHTDSVNVIKFIKLNAVSVCDSNKLRRSQPDRSISLLLSGSSDKTIRVWSTDTSSPCGYTQTHVLDEHKTSLNAIAVLPGSGIFVSGSADSELKFWQIELHQDTAEIDVKLLQTIVISPKFFPLALALAQPSPDLTILAVGGTKSFVQIYISSGHGKDFRLAATLTGHEGWIRSLNFVREESGDLLLASASQDKYIRLWRIHQGDQMPALKAYDPVLEDVGKSLSNKAHRFEVDAINYSITFEALLLGHEDWIFTAKWHQSNGKTRLLTASADNSLAIWEMDPDSAVWTSTVRLGEISSQKGATTATGSTGGFWIGLWSPNGDAVVSLGRTGSWRLWKHEGVGDSWEQDVAVNGHTKQVHAIAWAKNGAYLLSTGSDQTTRLFAEWRRDNKTSWHEFSRPQIHGYDLNCIDSIDKAQFISGADEKLLRVFEEPATVAYSLSKLCGISSLSSKTLPDAANIPVLGLSNKAIDAAENNGIDKDTKEDNPTGHTVVRTSTIETDRPPFEDHLSKYLLWPEIEKLYGHGYEISTVTASHDGKVVATACRASSIDHAVIRLYDTTDWQEIKPPLTAHSLTVTSLQFSGDDRYLLSVGRDRQCTVFERNADQDIGYILVTSNVKAHTRMILDGSWAPLQVGRAFATAGRDKNIHIWRLVGLELERITSVTALHSVTAVCFIPKLVAGSVVAGYGTDDGTIAIFKLSSHDLKLSGNTIILDHRIVPSRLITQLAWRPENFEPVINGTHVEVEPKPHVNQLAVASEDSSVRIYDIALSI